MKIYYYKKFVKHLDQRIKPNFNLYQKFQDRVQIFITDPNNPILNNHQLKGRKQNYRSFSITGDIRVIYYQTEDYVYFIDIGSHNQVY